MHFWTIRSCGFIWLFDPGHRRFVRVPPAWPLDVAPVEPAWVPYRSLVIDGRDRTFTVHLGEDGDRSVEGILHLDPCWYCRGGAPVDVRPGTNYAGG